MEYELEGEACPQCGNPELVYDKRSEEKVCNRCGLVIMDVKVNRGPEWRAFTLEEREEKRRTGIPSSYTYYDKGLYTSFRTTRDSYGRLLKSKTRRKMQRLKRYDTRSKLDESGMRNLSRAMSGLIRLTDKLHLPQGVREKAAMIYRRGLKKDLIRGRTISGFVAASVYAACRQKQIPRSLSEVSESSMEDEMDVARVYRYLVRELKLKMPVDYPMKFVPKIASALGIDRKTDRLTQKILKIAKEKKVLIGKDPKGMAAAALYIACKMNNENSTQKDIAQAAGTTEVTLRNRLKDLENFARAIEPILHQYVG